MRVVILALCFTAIAAVPRSPQRIVGGSVTRIEDYPTIAGLLYSWNSVTYWQQCVGTILSTRFILTAAHCPRGDALNRWRVRVGSAVANSGGVAHNVNLITVHPSYNPNTFANNVALMRTTTVIVNNAAVRFASIAPFNYFIEDNAIVWAAGWGYAHADGPKLDTLRHLQSRTVNQDICEERYASAGSAVTAQMLCIGDVKANGRGRCLSNDGGPVYHNGVVVGIRSWGRECGNGHFPSVNVRVSSFSDWILSRLP